MDSSVSTWAAPALAFVGSALAPSITHRVSRDEEAMRLLRWGVELALSEQEHAFRVGMTTLRTLVESSFVRRDRRRLARAILAEAARRHPSESRRRVAQ